MGYRYIGAKTQILEEVLSRVDGSVKKGAHITDLMCGTAAVSAGLRTLGYRVTAVDVMTYSFHHARVALNFTEPPAFAGAAVFMEGGSVARSSNLFPMTPYEQILEALNTVCPNQGYFWREFSLSGRPKNTEKPRNYFTPANAERIDGIRAAIRSLHSSGCITDLEHSLLLHDLIMATNDIANIAGTYGHYLSKTVERAYVPLRLQPSSLKISPDGEIHRVLQGYAEIVAGDIECDLCYIDPPYMKRQYAANYHVLETLAREDEPDAIGVSGLRPWRDQYSNFCTKTKIRDSFRTIFRTMRCPQFLISYSEDGLLPIAELKALADEFGKNEIRKLINKRFKSNDSSLAPQITEYLIHIRVS
jgi:adenine-specific DNA-methyltransferase